MSDRVRNNRITPRDRGLIKGAFRRVFSRSELRLKALDKTRITHSDIKRPKVTRWSWCEGCGLIEASYKMTVDHIDMVIPIERTADEMSFDELADRIWCDESNLQILCEPCHHDKSRIENKKRRDFKRAKAIAEGRVKVKNNDKKRYRSKRKKTASGSHNSN